jgi:hypothetical protein
LAILTHTKRFKASITAILLLVLALSLAKFYAGSIPEGKGRQQEVQMEGDRTCKWTVRPTDIARASPYSLMRS